MGRARRAHPCLFFFFASSIYQPNIMPFNVAKVQRISPGNHYPNNWNAFVGIFEMRSTSWHWCKHTHAYTQINNLFKCTPYVDCLHCRGNRKETKSQWICTVLFCRRSALMCPKTENGFSSSVFHCVCNGIHSSFFADAYFYGLYKIMIYFLKSAVKLKWMHPFS